ncbi:SDR family NAD(P)-dependent oxidoreductase [Nocardia seriolae]|uniref:Pteridine reductase n=1 Tax=Nocardia seriolae TaxID=37332 RepID=A0A0B8NB27_9NOCA|nr:SDR family NAD(P)-dependent oxidoreductase [Nocardia seriolae]APA95644.1 Pteridine reductase [Nocardia seriolae]MTJ66229.1 SDR family NAD(P)-dependent oxidoreductase [Nocardia seriolae]MTJ74459.1 SDR family NAD(P)-dependent oxidoreductase [Nocardia seriolae]MTJ85858.1 SDR family NAD(P)-dependent oxidoreductase [Nocardia seriolae]MTK29853.1 SDR family NAD(P)-dependent oxidoreductase [Nocardia seriolae]
MSATLSSPRTVLVTGADTRLGFATAQRVIADGDTVIAHILDKNHADETMQRLESAARPGRVRMVQADFTRLGEVDELGRTLAAELTRLDALINIASIAAPDARTHTEDGHELTLQVNYLAPHRLTTALLPALEAARGRVVTVTSKLHAAGNIDYSDLDRRRGIYTPLATYAQSKLALTMFSRSLAETGPAGLTSVSVHPADFEIDLPRLRSHRAAPLDTAAALLVQLATPTVPVTNGGYYEGTDPTNAAALVRNSRARTRLAAWSNQLTA